MRLPRAYRNALIAIAAVSLLLVAFVVTAGATDRPSFCRTCHEMDPYVDAWAVGPHKTTSCVECHVDSGMIARLSHKFVALGEVWSHVKGTPPFPLDVREPIPDRRCIRCHERVVVDIPRFDHARHAASSACERCHRAAGHEVSVAALKAAGVFNAGYRSPETTGVVVDGGSANLPGHKTVGCSRCHDMAETACPQCHEPEHAAGGAKKTGTCETCHQPGVAFTFTHPTTGSCSGCHTAPAKHRSGECSGCHRNAGKSWAFTHTRSSSCTSCHNAPSNHFGSACARCHTPSRSWASASFNHPRIRGGEHSYRSFGCAKCHPSGLTTYRCTCHKNPNGPSDD